jgi:hypothetical protein
MKALRQLLAAGLLAFALVSVYATDFEREVIDANRLAYLSSHLRTAGPSVLCLTCAACDELGEFDA